MHKIVVFKFGKVIDEVGAEGAPLSPLALSMMVEKLRKQHRHSTIAILPRDSKIGLKS